jgi:hypothetical protein
MILDISFFCFSTFFSENAVAVWNNDNEYEFQKWKGKKLMSMKKETFHIIETFKFIAA